MTDCAAPRHDGQDEPAPAEAHAQLCKPCRLGLAGDLRRLPRLHAELDHVPARGDGDGSGLPFSEPASECRDQIRHDLTYWARHITQLRGDDAPPVQPGPWSTLPVFVLAEWLRDQVTWCTFRDWAPDMAGAISADRSRALALLDPWVTKRFEIPGALGVCLACNGPQVSVTVYASDGDRRRSFIGCPGCGQAWEPEQWLSYGQRVIRRREAMASLPLTMGHTGHCGRLDHNRRCGQTVRRCPLHHPAMGPRRRLATNRQATHPLPLGRRPSVLREKTRKPCAAAPSVPLDTVIPCA